MKKEDSNEISYAQACLHAHRHLKYFKERLHKLIDNIEDDDEFIKAIFNEVIIHDQICALEKILTTFQKPFNVKKYLSDLSWASHYGKEYAKHLEETKPNLDELEKELKDFMLDKNIYANDKHD